MILSFKTTSLLVILTALAISGHATPPDTVVKNVVVLDPAKVSFREVGSLPKILKEASGLEMTEQGYFWSHNDGGIPALYCLDSTGNLVRAVQLNATNKGWEDLTRDDSGNFYIGGFGNNKNDRKELRVYRIPSPETIEAPVTNPEVITYSYEDQKIFPAEKHNKNFDVDAFFIWQESLYLFTKNRSSPFKGVSKIYRLPAQPGQQTARLIDSLFVGTGPMINNWITSADLSPDKQTLALLFHDRIWFIRNFTPGNFSKGRIYELTLKHYSHKAGLCWKDNDQIYIVDELEFDLLGGKMYSLDLGKVWKTTKP